jgi:hypothetical protein
VSSFDERRRPVIGNGCTIIIGGDGWEVRGIRCMRGGGFESRLIEDEH